MSKQISAAESQIGTQPNPAYAFAFTRTQRAGLRGFRRAFVSASCDPADPRTKTDAILHGEHVSLPRCRSTFSR